MCEYYTEAENIHKLHAAMCDIMGKLKLTVNEEKTRVCRLPEERFDERGCGN